MVVLKNIRKYWNKILNKFIPSRRERILRKIIENDENLGLYQCCGDWDEYGICKCKKNKNG